eukprot:TRINITY_DN1999_c0_g1_i2.p1 TRINITY_DN1999_c0_g1~~TRINITY_DN1999_c0_g1_i2.p1  ORF type:complete len:193 (+),score=19.05 TRINITY_DN1999_c0_g1_i2:234-812(+)
MTCMTWKDLLMSLAHVYYGLPQEEHPSLSRLCLNSVQKIRKEPYPCENFLKDLSNWEPKEKEAVHYGHLFDDEYKSEGNLFPHQEYDPYFLDDPRIKTLSARTVMTLPGFMGSIIFFSKPKALKRDLNAQFHQKHPYLHPSLTLTKIRTIKKLMVNMAMDAENILKYVHSATQSFGWSNLHYRILCGKQIEN